MRTIFVLFSFLVCLGLSAQELGGGGVFSKKPAPFLSSKKITIDGVWSKDKFEMGELVYLGLTIKIPNGYHIYPPEALMSSDKKNSVYPSKITYKEVPEFVTLGTAIFPLPEKKYYAVLEEDVFYYSDSIKVMIPAQINKGFELDQLELVVNLEYQMCDDKVCEMPTKMDSKHTLSKATEGISPQAINMDFFEGLDKTQMPVPEANDDLKFELFGFKIVIDPNASGSLAIILSMTVLGGFLLNFTPCVLPVIPLKIMSLTNTAKSRKRALSLGLVMFLGVISFWAFIGALIAFTTGFTAVNQMFQYPSFTVIVGVIILVMSIGMLGFFEINVPQKFSSLSPDFNSVGGSFGIGIMTAVLSTPCTAPFMGTASVWSLSKPPIVTLFLFLLIGFGMGIPYFLLSAFPQLIKWMPRGGEGSLVLKKVLGIFMLAAAFYFLGIGVITLFGVKSEPMASSYWWLVFGASSFGGGYLIYKTIQIAKKKLTKIVFSLLGLLIVLLSVQLLLTFVHTGGSEDASDLNWVPYSKSALEDAKKEGRPILLDFTAEWCLNCKVLEKTVLQTVDAKKMYEEKNVILMKVDITDGNAEANELLKAEGSITIPYLVLYSKDGNVLFRGDFYTLKSLQDALKN